MKNWPLTLVPFLLTACAVEQNEDDPGIRTAPYHLAEPASSLEGVKIPVLKSATLERKWGKPKMAVLPDGGYMLSYSIPGEGYETLRIFGAPGRIDSDAPEPPSYTDLGPLDKNGRGTTQRFPQKWSTVTLLGRPIHYYLRSPGGGSDAPEVSTVSFPVETPGAPTASYRITAISNLEDGGRISEDYMKTVSFQR